MSMLQVGEVQDARKLAVPGLLAVTVAVCGVVPVAAMANAKLWEETQVTGTFVRDLPFESTAVAVRDWVPAFARLKGAVPPLLVAMASEVMGQVSKVTSGLLLPLTLA
jgi:hypothetical protein